MPKSNETLRLWSRAAPYWEKHRDTIRGMFAPITQALIEDTRIDAGYSVLDVATGPGEPALSIAEITGPRGSVAGTDPVPEMIAAANREAQRCHLTNVRFEIAHAEAQPFPENHFDAAVCRFGVMFFPSPVNGVREMLRVSKPGRKIAFAVWHFAERNPFHSMFAKAVEPYAPAEPLPPDAPDAFRYAASGKLLNILNDAGANAPSERLLQFRIEAPLRADEFWTLRCQMSDKLRAKLAAFTEDQFAAVRHEVMEDLRSYSTAQGISIPAEVLIVSGTKA